MEEDKYFEELPSLPSLFADLWSHQVESQIKPAEMQAHQNQLKMWADQNKLKVWANQNKLEMWVN